MALTKQAIALIGRIHPEIFDILGNPYGPYGHVGVHAFRTAAHAAVHAPGAPAELNPQPLPPRSGLVLGIAAGNELLQLGRTATQLGVAFDVDLDDWCGTPPKPRPPWWWGGWWPGRDVPQEWWWDYNLGVALVLEASQLAWEGTRAADVLERAHDVALDTAAKGVQIG